MKLSLHIPAVFAAAVLLITTSPIVHASLLDSSAGLALSRKGLLVTAFDPPPDGNTGTLLRVWNQTEEGGPLTVTLPVGFKVRHNPWISADKKPALHSA